jgi:Tfp pilus assembly protein PilN
MELLLALAIVALVAAFVSVPLRRGASEEGESGDGEELADLEIRKQAKYREIRDAEADHAAGKLSDDDYRRLDEELRREAVEILKRMDRLRPD